MAEEFSRAMKTLFILSVASGYGGAERSIELILRHFPSDIRVCIFAQNREHLTQLSRPGALPRHAKMIELGQTDTLAGKRLAALRLALHFIREKPDCLLLNTHTSALLAAMAAKLLPKIGSHCYLYVRDFLWTDLEYIFTRLSGARVLVPNAVVAERCGYLTPWHLSPVGNTDWAIIPDMTEIFSGPVTYSGAFLHLATVNPWKGHADLMLATEMLISQGRPISVHSQGIVGNGQLRERLAGLIDRLNIGERFTLSGYTPDPSPLLQQCQAVLVPSVSHSGGPETFGRTIIEAWAFRKPVIAYAAGAPARLIRNGVDGLLVPEGDTVALAEAMYRLHTDTALCRRLGEVGHARVIESYLPEKVTGALLEHLLPHRNRPT